MTQKPSGPARPPAGARLGWTSTVLLVLSGAWAVVGGVGATGTARIVLVAVAALAAVATLTSPLLRTAVPRLSALPAAGALAAFLAVAGCLHILATGEAAAIGPVGLAIVIAATLPRARAVAAFAATVVLALAASWTAAALLPLPGSGAGDPSLGAVAAAALTLVAAVLVALPAHAGLAALRARLAEAEEVAQHLAVRDALTGAANRRGLDMVALPMIENARRQGEAVHCLFVDVDAFATVNATLGRGCGDEVLVAVATALTGSTRGTDIVARWSGDEFVVIGPGVGTSPLEMERRVRSRVLGSPPVPLEVWQPRVSVGSATLVPWDDGDLETLLQRAEQDMTLRRSLRRQSTLPRRPDGRPAPSHPVPDSPDA